MDNDEKPTAELLDRLDDLRAWLADDYESESHQIIEGEIDEITTILGWRGVAVGGAE